MSERYSAELVRGAAEVEHVMTITPVAAYRELQTLDPHRYPDWEIKCSCGQRATCSWRKTAEQWKLNHLDGDPLEWPDEDDTDAHTDGGGADD